MPPRRSDEALTEHWSFMDEHRSSSPSPDEKQWLADFAHGSDEDVPGVALAHDECDRRAA
jgi:hypothetical protein